MKIDVVMPQMGESVVESTITKWYKEVGDRIERDEELLELSADKVDADVPSPVSGVIVEILHPTGTTVEVNTLIAIIETDAAEAGASSTAEEGAAGPSQPVATSAGVSFAEALVDSERRSADELRRVRSTPLVRKMAEEHGITDLSGIAGSGLSGRVTKDDLVKHLEARAEAPSVVRTAGVSIPAQATAPQASPLATTSAGSPAAAPVAVPAAVTAVAPAVSIPIYPTDRVELLSPQRQAIAQHMVASRATSPHAHTVHEMDFGRVVRSREANKKAFAERGAKLTYTAYLVVAVAQALRDFPEVNVSLQGTQLIRRGEINVGVAVDIGSSLVVPVIKRADELNLLGVARAVEDIATRARNKKLTPDDLQGGTFTVSNHGIYGPEFGIPIINQPQSAILSTGAIKKRVVVDQKTDAIMVRPTSIGCLSFDHRTIDGATADRFMARLRTLIGEWEDL